MGLPIWRLSLRQALSFGRITQGKFTKSSITLPGGTYSGAVWLDCDHDYDVDLFLLGEHSVLMRNNGTAGFSDETKSFPFVTGKAVAGVMFDLVPDTDPMDLVVAYADRPGVLYRDRLNGKYEAEDLPVVPPRAVAIRGADMDNDRATDLIISTDKCVYVAWNRTGGFVKSAELATPGGVAAIADFENRGFFDIATGGIVYRNEGGKFAERKSELRAKPAALLTADFGGSHTGIATIDGSAVTLNEDITPGNGFMHVGLTGVKNIRLSYGAKVEVKAGSYYAKQTYRGVPLGFGVPSAYKEADTVRITWPNGLIQNEVHQTLSAHVYKEAQRLSGSCPMIFTWTGTGFRFLTDVLGVVSKLGFVWAMQQLFPGRSRRICADPGRSDGSEER